MTGQSGSPSVPGPGRASMGAMRDGFPRTDFGFRAQSRHSIRLPTIVTSHATGWQGPGDTLDLGLGGMRVLLRGPLERGEHLAVALDTPTRWDPLVTSARVVWTRHVGELAIEAGLRFEHATPEGVFAMHQLIETLVFDS